MTILWLDISARVNVVDKRKIAKGVSAESLAGLSSGAEREARKRRRTVKDLQMRKLR
jgi:hypothetical protein